MNAPTSPPARSKRIYVLWGVALALLFAAGLLCWMVLPAWRARNEVRAAFEKYDPPVIVGEIVVIHIDRTDRVTKIIDGLGGPREAGRKIHLYLELPQWLARREKDDCFKALMVLSNCKEHGIPGLIQLLDSKYDVCTRATAMIELADMGRKADQALPAMDRIAAAEEKDDKLIAGIAAEMAKRIRAARQKAEEPK